MGGQSSLCAAVHGVTHWVSNWTTTTDIFIQLQIFSNFASKVTEQQPPPDQGFVGRVIHISKKNTFVYPVEALLWLSESEILAQNLPSEMMEFCGGGERETDTCWRERLEVQRGHSGECSRMPASGRSPLTDFCVDPACLVTDSGRVGHVEVAWPTQTEGEIVSARSHCNWRWWLPSLFTPTALFWSLTVIPHERKKRVCVLGIESKVKWCCKIW